MIRRRRHSAFLIGAIVLLIISWLSCLLNMRDICQDVISPISYATLSESFGNSSNIYERNHSKLCQSFGSTFQLLILVNSAPSHTQSRNAIRLTWGNNAKQSGFALAFFIGIPPTSLRSEIEEEDILHGDMIIARFVDSYYNLTLKTIIMLQWANTYCNRVPRMLKTDDDMFINIPKLSNFIKNPDLINVKRTIWGRVMEKWSPMRARKSKYFVSRTQFPGKKFPKFATGPAYLITTDIIKDILHAVETETYFILEDVFITGVIADKLGINRQHVEEFYNRVIKDSCLIKKCIAVHDVKVHEQFEWLKIQDGKKKCGKIVRL